jgi:hypothetical protein
MIRKSKFSIEFKNKPRNMNLSHGQTFGTTAKPSIPVPLLEDGLILSFCATERIYLKRKIPHKKTRDWKWHMLF